MFPGQDLNHECSISAGCTLSDGPLAVRGLSVTVWSDSLALDHSVSACVLKLPVSSRGRWWTQPSGRLLPPCRHWDPADLWPCQLLSGESYSPVTWSQRHCDLSVYKPAHKCLEIPGTEKTVNSVAHLSLQHCCIFALKMCFFLVSSTMSTWCLRTSSLWSLLSLKCTASAHTGSSHLTGKVTDNC